MFWGFVEEFLKVYKYWQAKLFSNNWQMWKFAQEIVKPRRQWERPGEWVEVDSPSVHVISAFQDVSGDPFVLQN